MATSLAAWLTALLYFESVSWPEGACSRIGLVPLAVDGKDGWSVEVASWLLVPGSDELSLVTSPSCCETTTRATVAHTQTAITTNRWRTQNRAKRYRTPVIHALR